MREGSGMLTSTVSIWRPFLELHMTKSIRLPCGQTRRLSIAVYELAGVSLVIPSTSGCKYKTRKMKIYNSKFCTANKLLFRSRRINLALKYDRI